MTQECIFPLNDICLSTPRSFVDSIAFNSLYVSVICHMNIHLIIMAFTVEENLYCSTKTVLQYTEDILYNIYLVLHIHVPFPFTLVWVKTYSNDK